MSHYPSRRTRSLDTRQQRMWRRNQNTTTFAPSANLGPVAHTVLVAMMIAILGLIYLTQVTKTSSFGYDIEQRKTALAELRAEQQDLEIENARLQALERVQDSSVAKALEAPEAVEYARN